MTLGLVDDGEEEDRHEEADAEASDVGKVVDAGYESEGETDDDLDDEVDELANWSVLNVPVRKKVAVEEPTS